MSCTGMPFVGQPASRVGRGTIHGVISCLEYHLDYGTCFRPHDQQSHPTSCSLWLAQLTDAVPRLLPRNSTSECYVQHRLLCFSSACRPHPGQRAVRMHEQKTRRDPKNRRSVKAIQYCLGSSESCAHDERPWERPWKSKDAVCQICMT